MLPTNSFASSNIVAPCKCWGASCNSLVNYTLQPRAHSGLHKCLESACKHWPVQLNTTSSMFCVDDLAWCSWPYFSSTFWYYLSIFAICTGWQDTSAVRSIQWAQLRKRPSCRTLSLFSDGRRRCRYIWNCSRAPLYLVGLLLVPTSMESLFSFLSTSCQLQLQHNHTCCTPKCSLVWLTVQVRLQSPQHWEWALSWWHLS